MRYDLLYRAVEQLAKDSYGILDTPAEGLTIAQASEVATEARRLIRAVSRLNVLLSEHMTHNSAEFLKKQS